MMLNTSVTSAIPPNSMASRVINPPSRIALRGMIPGRQLHQVMGCGSCEVSMCCWFVLLMIGQPDEKLFGSLVSILERMADRQGSSKAFLVDLQISLHFALQCKFG